MMPIKDLLYIKHDFIIYKIKMSDITIPKKAAKRILRLLEIEDIINLYQSNDFFKYLL